MATVLGANSVTGGYEVENSLRFSRASSTGLQLDLGTPTNAKKYTISFWIKREVSGISGEIIAGGADASNETFIRMNGNGLFQFKADHGSATGWQTTPNALGRDPSAWYHYIAAVDTSQSTASNRVKIYLNGVLQSLGTANYPDQDDAVGFLNNDNVIHIGTRNYDDDIFFDGYLCEFVFLDGQTLDPTSFGEFDSDSGIWKPIKVSGLTFGDNGYYLEFKQAGTSQNASGMGADTSGNTDHWAVASLTAVDQSTDTCTNNFATMNSLDNFFSGSAFTEGNCKIVTTNGNITYNTSTIGFSSGKWYMETKLAGSAGFTVGVVRGVATANDNDNKLGNRADGFSYDDGGAVEGNGGDLGGSFATYEADDIIGVYADLDNNELYFSKNGALQNSGTGLALTAGTYFFAVGDNNSSNSSTYEVNFGNPVSALSSAVSDGEYGAFEYSTTITGDSVSKTFKALNTKNLAEFG